MSMFVTEVVTASISVTDTQQIVAIPGVPDNCILSWMSGAIDGIATAAATITWGVCSDAAGDNMITGNKLTETIVVGDTTATDGGVSSLLSDRAWASGDLYLAIKCNTGTCNLVLTLYVREER